VTATLALPDQAPAGAMILIHEWWGLNDQIKAVAADFANAFADYDPEKAKEAWDSIYAFFQERFR
jgi:dienelactone hydrolase